MVCGSHGRLPEQAGCLGHSLAGKLGTRQAGENWFNSLGAEFKHFEPPTALPNASHQHPFEVEAVSWTIAAGHPVQSYELDIVEKEWTYL